MNRTEPRHCAIAWCQRDHSADELNAGLVGHQSEHRVIAHGDTITAELFLSAVTTTDDPTRVVLATPPAVVIDSPDAVSPAEARKLAVVARELADRADPLGLSVDPSEARTAAVTLLIGRVFDSAAQPANELMTEIKAANQCGPVLAALLDVSAGALSYLEEAYRLDPLQLWRAVTAADLPPRGQS